MTGQVRHIWRRVSSSVIKGDLQSEEMVNKAET